MKHIFRKLLQFKDEVCDHRMRLDSNPIFLKPRLFGNTSDPFFLRIDSSNIATGFDGFGAMIRFLRPSRIRIRGFMISMIQIRTVP